MERFALAVAEADLNAPVPTCPRWSTYDLVVHLGNVHAWAATIVETGRAAAEQNDDPGTRRARTVSEWYAGKAEDLYEVLRSTDPERPCWNFAFGDGVAEFWQRRQLHETTIHSVDLGSAAARGTSISPLLAEDGIDEVLRVFLHRMHHRGHPAALTAPLSLEASDTGRSWTLTPRPAPPTDPDVALPTQPRGPFRRALSPSRGTPSRWTAELAPEDTEGPPLVIDRRHPSADLLTGGAATIYRVLWGRSPVQDLELSGDLSRIGAFLGSRLVP